MNAVVQGYKCEAPYLDPHPLVHSKARLDFRAGTPSLRANNLCPYYTMFPLSYPAGVLAAARPGEWVLDPFCGRGTTNFACRVLGLPSVGIDSNPVAVAIAQAKLASATPQEVIALCERLLEGRGDPDVPTGEFWSLCFHPDTLRDIVRLRAGLLADSQSDEARILRALILGILHGPRNKGKPTYLSNQMPRTYATKPTGAVKFWRRHGLAPEYVDVRDAIARRARFSLSDLPSPTPGEILHGDSRFVAASPSWRPFTWIVTSPPYFGMRTYVPDQWLRFWFLGGPDDVVYDQEGQLGAGGLDDFISNLGMVWRRVAALSAPGARLVVRFGALPCLPLDPAEILDASLGASGVGWVITGVRNAGDAEIGKRQASQFGRTPGGPIREIDLHARLDRA